MATIGQSPRDDLVPYMQQQFSRPVEVLQAGVLDNLDAQAIADLGPEAGEVGIVARLRDGSSVLLSHEKILPRMQAVVDGLVEQGALFTTILCGADWSDIRSSRLVVNPGRSSRRLCRPCRRTKARDHQASAGQIEQNGALLTARHRRRGHFRLSLHREARLAARRGGGDSCVPGERRAGLDDLRGDGRGDAAARSSG